MENLHAELQNLLDSRHEWLLIHSSGKSFALKNTEIELESKNRKTLFSFLDDTGFQTWRVGDFQTKNGEIKLNLARNFDREREKIRLVPRESAQNLINSIELARLAKAAQIAAIIKENNPRTKLIRVELNKQNGRFAQIIFESLSGGQIAVLADVSGGLSAEIMISTAMFWLAKLENRKKKPIDKIWILAEKKQAKTLRNLHALLRENWQNKILLKELTEEIDREKSKSKKVIENLPALKISDLWRGKRRDLKIAGEFEPSETARKIIEISPANIDRIYSKHGETLRFNGLPFVRIRKFAGLEKVWFGIEKAKSFLSESGFAELAELIENLQIFRRAASLNKRHEFFRHAPEAWLESILRKNIKLLDANLILSPVYHQFRADRDKIDLLALRSDGRIVIIELKTAPDREMVFQAADYWRKLERERRLGNLFNAKLFGDLKIADKPVIVYLVAPTLSFHPNFDLTARAISGEIEIHRFNLAENWRENLKVLERRNLAGKKIFSHRWTRMNTDIEIKIRAVFYS